MLKRTRWRHTVRCTTAAPQNVSPQLARASCCTSFSHLLPGVTAVRAAAPLCTAARAASSTQPSSSSAASVSSPPASRRDTKKLRFWTPGALTHETLSYAQCPLCSATFHMREMLFHITVIHKDEDVAYWTEQVNARLALYERVVGIPLAQPNGAATLFEVARSTGTDVFSLPEGLFTDLKTNEKELRAFLPTITPAGSYVCNWCTVKRAPFPTRDALLLHVAKDHPLLNFDLIESLVPQPSSALPSSSPAATTKPAKTTATTSLPESDSSVSEMSWSPAGGRDAADLNAESRGFRAWDAGEMRLGPTRRMHGVETVHESNTVAVKLDARRLRVSVARSDGAIRAPIPIGTLADREVGNAADSGTSLDEPFFHEYHFPCELCLKVFTSELNLLQHLEAKHASPPLAFTTGGAGAEAAARSSSAAEANGTSPPPPLSVSEVKATATSTATTAAAADASGQAPMSICVTCDLCCKGVKIYTLPSALFAHIRFCHRNVDTTYEAERMMREQRNRSVFLCSHCKRAFADAAQLRDHVWNQHPMERGVLNLEVANLASAGTAKSAAATEDAEMVAKYTCATLPPFSMKTRWWCTECERGFRTGMSLASHQREKHLAVTELFPCPKCRRVFHDVFTLEEHIKSSHRGIKLVDLVTPTTAICPHCNLAFLSHEALHMHCVRHHNKDPHSPVRSFAKPGDEPAAGVGAEATARGATTSAAVVTPAGEATSQLAAPPKPRKVSRRRKTSSPDA